MNHPPRSALLVEIPEAEPSVHAHRLRFDSMTERGVPAHVTVLFPFMDRQDLGDLALERIARVAAAHDSFDFSFSSTAWFERLALYLPPDDPAPFVRLTADVAGAFPAYPPYEGAYDEPVPHLTVARWTDKADLGAVEDAVRQGLPISGRAQHLTMMTEDDEGRWSVARRFPFGALRSG